MNLSFMIPLSIVFVSAYLFRKSSDEIVYLCGIIAIIALVITLIIAPWQIQLFLLVMAALSTIKFRQQNQTEELEIDNNPHLLYRGNNYEHNSSKPKNIEIAEADLAGKYRGQAWKNHHSEEAATPQTFHLTYRGSTVECQKYMALSEEEKADH